MTCPEESSMTFMRSVVVLIVLSLCSLPVIAQDLDWVSMGPASGNFTCLHADDAGTALYAGTIEGFWYYTFGTETWTSRDDVGWIGRQVWCLTSHVNDPATVITGRENAFFKGYMEWTDDWGATNTYAYSSDGGSVKDVKGIPGSPDTYIACTWSDIVQGEVIRSTDGGQTWILLSGYIHHAMTEISVDQSTPNTIYISGSSQVTKSTDGGDSWASASTGLPGTLGVYCVDSSPHTPQTLLCANDDGIHRSTDGGSSWSFVPTGYANPACQHFAFSPVTPGLVAAITFSPYTVILSEDDGLTWTDVSGDVAGLGLQDIVFSHDGATLYVATYNNGIWSAAVGGPGTVACSYECTPGSGTLPFGFQHQVVLQNLYKDQTRRMAARIDVTLGNGTSYNNWRGGHTNIAPLGQYAVQWTTNLPAIPRVVGDNTFALLTEDVTPAPFNQPPYPMSGDTATASCTVTGIAP
jgi:photosystem II stability/assembly factor-like uncharacterized protein